MTSPVTTPKTFRTEICRALAEGLAADPRLILMGEDICAYGGAFAVTGDLSARFPDRLINTPISEGGFIGVATGAAVGGMRVVAEIMFMDFITLAMDQLVNHAAKLHYMYAGQVSVPLVVRAPFGGYRGYGPSHSQSLGAWFMNVPGLKVVAPGSADHAAALLTAAIADDNPVIFLEHKLLYGEHVSEAGPQSTATIGKARIARAGDNVSIITYGYGVRMAQQAADHLAGEGISAEIVDLVTLKPYDAETVFASVRKTGRAVFFEEGVVCAGVTAELCAAVAEECLWDLDGGLKRIGAREVPIPSAGPSERMVLPSVADVVQAVHSVMG